MAKNILIIFASLLLLHSVCVHSLPTTKVEDNSSSSDESNEAELSERIQLLFFTLKELSVFSNYTAEQGKILFKKVLADPILLQQKTDALQPHLTNLTKFVTETEHLEKLSDNLEKKLNVFELAVNFTEILDMYNTTEIAKPTAEHFLIEKSMQRNGFGELEPKFIEHFFRFVEKFNVEIERYIGTMSVEEKAKEAKMIEWHTQFKAEADKEKKVEMFSKFFELIDKDI